MPGTLAHVNAQIVCPHMGQAQVVTTNARVKVSQQFVALQNDQYAVAGCSFVVGTVPQPCVLLRWLVPATRVKVMGQPVLLQGSSGLSQNAEQAPQGPPEVMVTQVRVKGI